MRPAARLCEAAMSEGAAYRMVNLSAADPVARGRDGRRRALLAASGCLAVLAVLLGPAVHEATAALGVIPAGQPGGLVADTSTTQAGSPADGVTSFTLDPAPLPTVGGGTLRDTIVDLPAGLIGNPQATPRCTTLLPVDTLLPLCALGSQVGTVDFSHVAFGVPFRIVVPLFNMEPARGQVADLAFILGGTTIPVHVGLSVRPTDYGVRATTRRVTQYLPIANVRINVWGIPGAASHDAQRCIAPQPENGNPLDPTVNWSCLGTPGDRVNGPNTVSSDLRPFLINPTACDAPKITSVSVSSWNDPTTFTEQLASAPTPTGCDKLQFEPTIDVTPDATQTDAPTGLSVSLKFPQNNDPGGLATGQLKDAHVTLPDGVTISPSSAGGLAACSDEQLGLGTDNPVQCPQASKIGEVTAETPVLEKPVKGAVYVGTQRSLDPESGDMFRIFLVLDDPDRGLLIKLKGQVRADSRTGQLATTFQNNPQVPVRTLDLKLKSGPRAPLATPLDCGGQTVTSTLTAWSGQATPPLASFSVGCRVPAPGFAPTFVAGTMNPVAGAFSPLMARIARGDGQEYMDGLSMEMPGGLVAKLRGVPLCEDAAAAAGTCPAESRIGTARVSAGPGSSPFQLAGPVALTTGYKGAPYGLSVAVPAVAGPFDLGTVVVRQAIYVDPVDAHLTVLSDPLPTIVKGVPVRMRAIDVDVDRTEFSLNPTNCGRKDIAATFHSDRNSSASSRSRFQVADCASLALKPSLRMALKDRRQLTTGKHPGLNAVLTQRGRQSNLKDVAVALPLSLALDPKNAESDTLCSFEESGKPDPRCPRSSIIGTARAVTPLLNRPLTAPVYFSKDVRMSKIGRPIRTLPKLVIPLRGEVALNVVGKSSVARGGKLVTTFSGLPDAAVSRFELKLKGGPKGILVANANACKRSRVAAFNVDGQNGKRADRRVTISAPCGKAKKKSKR